MAGRAVRIRQIRPEFFTDPVTAHMAPATQVTYIGLWCVADDAGWLECDLDQLGALLYPYKSGRVRTQIVVRACIDLEKIGRLLRWECGCALIPTLSEHQKIGGNKSFVVRDKHSKHKSIRVHTNPDGSIRNVTVSKVGNGTGEADASGAASLGERLVAAGVKPELVS